MRIEKRERDEKEEKNRMKKEKSRTCVVGESAEIPKTAYPFSANVL